MRRLFAFALILALLLATAAMGEETFLDDTGAPVSPEAPTRVAALSGSLAQIWLLAGGQVACVTQDALEERDLGLGEDVVNAGSLKTPSAELILAAGVDFALLTPTLSGHIALGETLRAAGVRTAFFDVETFEDYLRCLDFCTRLTGQPSATSSTARRCRRPWTKPSPWASDRCKPRGCCSCGPTPLA